MKKYLKILPVIAILNLTTFCTPAITKSNSNLSQIKLPKGFQINTFASNITNAREMALGDKGTIFVGTTGDKVYAIKNGKTTIIASGLNRPNGVAFKNGSLYVAEISKVTRYDNIELNLSKPPKPVTIASNFPTETHHGYKYIAFGPDGKLYIPVGAPCNVCKQDDERFGTLMRMNADGSNQEIYARGIRNTVGFDWNPNTKTVWFTDNGRDMLGDDIPSDELNSAPKAGMNFGFPYCHQGDIADPEFGSQKKCNEFTPPELKLGAHVASLGMKFYNGNMFPSNYKNGIFIAEHGSWNRSTPIGYRVVFVEMKNNKAIKYNIFAEGWLKNSNVSGRPVDILNMNDGSILVSDDASGAIYRVSYK